MVRLAGEFLRFFVKVGAHMAVRGGNAATGKLFNTEIVDGVCVWTDDGIDRLWGWLQEQFLTPRERREAVAEFANLSQQELRQELQKGVFQDAAASPPEVQQHLLSAAVAFQANVRAQCDPPDALGQSVLKPGVHLDSREQFASLFRCTASALPVLMPGDVLNERFVIRRELGRGGMGVVHSAYDRQENTDVALKAIRPDSAGIEAFRERFFHEIRLSKTLSHPSIVRIHDSHFDRQRRLCFLTMEQLPGRTLEVWLAARKPRGATLEEFKRLASAMCAAMHHAHEKGVLHCDLKPGNVMVDDELRRIKLLDFGLAKLTAPRAIAPVSVAGYTPYHVAPEQLHDGKANRQSDVYALGVLYYCVLTNTVPMYGSGTIARKRPDLPVGILEALSPAVQKAMAESPEDRYTSVRAFYSELCAAWQTAATVAAPGGRAAALSGHTGGLGARDSGKGLAAQPSRLANLAALAKRLANSAAKSRRLGVALILLVLLISFAVTTPWTRRETPSQSSVRTEKGVFLAQKWISEVNAIRFSPDGREILVGSSDGAFLLDSSNLSVIRNLKGHDGPVRAIAFSADGKRVATGSADSTARVWDLQTGSTVRLISGHTGPVRAVAFSAGGSKLVTGSSDLTVRVWTITTGEENMRSPTQNAAIAAVGFRDDDRMLVTVDEECRIARWYLRTGEKLFASGVITGFRGYSCLSADNRYALVASGGGLKLDLVDTDSGRLVSSFATAETSLALALSDDCQLLLVSHFIGELSVCDAMFGGRETLRVSVSRPGLIQRLALSPDKSRAAVLSGVGDVQLWQLPLPKP